MNKIHRLHNLSELKSHLSQESLLLLTEEKVWELYRSEFSQLAQESLVYIFPSGEQAKTLQAYEKCLEHLLNHSNLNRHSHVIALGGGALSDAAGFVAATLFRGISWSVIPTTLLSQVDACLGGKTALNTAQGKNLIGSFHQPEVIYLWEGFLESLPERQWQSGKGEILKYAMLSEEIEKLVLKNEPWSVIINACLSCKKKIIEKDPLDQGLRFQLNLGHTLGHAVESETFPHGLAVAWGIEQKVKKYMPYLEEKFFQLKQALKLSYPDVVINNEKLKYDKKRNHHNKLSFVLLDEGRKPFLKTEF